MTIDISQFFQVFFEEAGEHLAEMERQTLELDGAKTGDDALAKRPGGQGLEQPVPLGRGTVDPLTASTNRPF